MSESKHESYLESLCYEYFRGLGGSIYEVLEDVVPLNLPRSSSDSTKLASYDELRTQFPPSVFNYQRIAMVAILNGDYDVAEQAFSEAKKLRPDDPYLEQKYQLILEHKDKLREMFTQYYTNRASMEPRFYAPDEPKDVSSVAPESPGQPAKISKGTKVVIGGLAALTLLGGLSTLYFAGEANILRVQNSSLLEDSAKKEAQISEYQTKIGDLEVQLNQLAEQLKGTPKEKVIIYLREVLDAGETITHEVASYLSSVNGLPYPALGFADRIHLIADYCKLIYDANGIPLDKASEITKRLPTGYSFYMPEAKLYTENGKWRLSGTYIRKSDGKIVNFELRQENYNLDP